MTRPDRATVVVEQAFEQIAAPDHEHDSAWVVRGEETGSPSDPVVLHVHPTTASGGWFGDPADAEERAAVDAVVRAQVAPFGGRVWSPRYRQASTRAFHERDAGGEHAYDLAYRDVSAAFAQLLVDELLVDELPEGAGPAPVRPLVLVGHSQGARHVRALLAEFFDHDGLADRLVAAYVVGTGLEVDDPVLDDFPLATTPDATGVVVAYQARLAGALPRDAQGADPRAADAEGGTACVSPAALGLREGSGVLRAGGHLLLGPGRVGALAQRALPDGRLHHVEVEVLADVLAADVRRRTAAWWAARGPEAPVHPASRDRRWSSTYARGEVPYWPGARGRTHVVGPTSAARAWHVVDLPGPRDAVPVVLLHKLGGWVADWRGVAERLAGERRVVVVDLPGHGGSTRPGPTPWALWPGETARGLAGLLDALGIARAHVVGSSLGGVVATLLAHAEPARVVSLALVGTSLTPRFTAARTLEVDRAVRGGFDRGWVPRPGQNGRAGTSDPRVLAEQDTSRAQAGRWVRPSERGVGLTGVEHLLPGLSCPTLYLNGENAGYRSYEEVAGRLLPHGRVGVVAGCGSFPHQERPGAVVAAWGEFVRVSVLG